MEKQPPLFDLKMIPVEEKRSDTRPVKKPYIKDPQKEDILLLDLTLSTRDWYRQWIVRYEDEFSFKRENILLPHQLSLINKYFFPQEPDGRWLNQSEILGSGNTSSFRVSAIKALARIFNRIEVQKISLEEYSKETALYYGSRAIEYLKPNNQLYNFLRERELYLVDNVNTLSSKEVKKLCAHQNNYNELEEAMQKFFPGWKREISYIPKA